MKIFIFSFLTIQILMGPAFGSDNLTFEQIQAIYEKNLTSPSSLASYILQHEEETSPPVQPTTHQITDQMWKAYERARVKIEKAEAEAKRARAVAKKLEKNKAVRALISKELPSDIEEAKLRLFHALTAGTSFLLSQIDRVIEDKETLEWTYSNSLLYDKETGGEKLPLKGETSIPIKGKNGKNTQALIIPNSYCYEILRQSIHIELQTLLNLVSWWRKVIFPNNTFESYQAINALALKKAINFLLEKRNNVSIKTLPNNHYVFSIIHILTDIVSALPEQSCHIIWTAQSMEKKTDLILELLKQKENTFNKIFVDYYFGTCAPLYTKLKELMIFPSICLQNPMHMQEIKRDYEKFRKFTFPINETKKIRVASRSLDLHDAISALIANFFIKEESAHPSQVESAAIGLVGQVPSPLPAAHAASEPEHAFAEDSSPESPELEETIIYDSNYWKAEHEAYQLRKNSPKPSLAVKASLLSQSEEYRIRLLTYLREHIFSSISAYKPRQLISDLKELCFDVTPNTVGNGSTYYVRPTSKNPLFSNDLRYQGAYFNIHLPHDDSPIPYAYYRYLRSGFEHVFGLTKDEALAV